MTFFTDAKLRAGSILREWKEKRAERQAQKQTAAALNSEHGHGRFFLLTVPATATIFAAIVEVYWAFLFCIEATGHVLLDWSTAVGSNVPAAGEWHFAFTVNSVMVLIGLACATVPIVMISMVWLPVQFTMRGTGRWRRGTMIFCGLLANLLVIVSGTVVMNGNRQEQVRESVVVEQTAAQGRAAIDARLAFEQEQLRLALNNSNPYLNQAANVGAAEWERSYVAQARATNDARLPMLERALGAARAADARRANIEALTVQRAVAAPEAATASNVEDAAGRPLNEFSQAVQVWRPPFVAFICTLVGIFGAWWTLALMQGLNPRDVLRSGWADEGHRIEDLRGQDVVDSTGKVKDVEPLTPPKRSRRVYNAETGREEVFVQPKGYWRGTGKKQQNADGTEGELTEFVPDVGPEDKGAKDGGKRTAMTVGGPIELPESVDREPAPAPVEASEAPPETGIIEQGVHDEHKRDAEDNSESEAVAETQPEPSQQDYDELAQELELALPDLPVNAPDQDEQNDASAEPDQNGEHVEPRTEPETNPARMIAAE